MKSCGAGVGSFGRNRHSSNYLVVLSMDQGRDRLRREKSAKVYLDTFISLLTYLKYLLYRYIASYIKDPYGILYQKEFSLAPKHF